MSISIDVAGIPASIMNLRSRALALMSEVSLGMSESVIELALVSRRSIKPSISVLWYKSLGIVNLSVRFAVLRGLIASQALWGLALFQCGEFNIFATIFVAVK